MKRKIIILGIVLLLAATAVWGQEGATQPVPATPPPAQSTRAAARTPGRSPARPQRMAMAGADVSFEGRLQDMQNTLTQMHALLQDMQARTRTGQAATAKSGVAKASAAESAALTDNVRMWELLLNHLDTTMSQARMTAMHRSMSQRINSSQLPAAPPNGGALAPAGADSAPSPVSQP